MPFMSNHQHFFVTVENEWADKIDIEVRSSLCGMLYTQCPSSLNVVGSHPPVCQVWSHYV